MIDLIDLIFSRSYHYVRKKYHIYVVAAYDLVIKLVWYARIGF